MLNEAYLKIEGFESRARIRGQDRRGGLETFSMLMLDFDYDGEIFSLDAAHYAAQLQADEWRAWFPAESIGAQVMAVFMDIYGNEAREVIPRERFRES
jgi:site-specific DNA-methyltransferase (adenine-specific)/adenine-specific DNA-methyltransferase